ncbi:MAG: hypothetical protein HY649_09810 [Acidobacteria bacterium]|nr:hypothetical protein [Acidobacteriota bacterium]
MLKRTTILILAMYLVSVGLYGQNDPLMGTWKLNLAKSKYSPGPPPKSNIQKREASGANGVKYTADMVTALGEARHIEYTANYDGKDYPIKGDPNRDTVSLKRLDAHNYEGTDKKGGKVVIIGRGVVSPDGKTLTITSKGTNAQGRTVNDVAVFDKQ